MHIMLCLRYSYAAFILSNLPDVINPEGLKRLVMYDVGCRLEKHLQANGSELLQRFRFAVPAFHRFAHNLECQVSLLFTVFVFTIYFF